MLTTLNVEDMRSKEHTGSYLRPYLNISFFLPMNKKQKFVSLIAYP